MSGVKTGMAALSKRLIHPELHDSQARSVSTPSPECLPGPERVPHVFSPSTGSLLPTWIRPTWNSPFGHSLAIHRAKMSSSEGGESAFWQKTQTLRLDIHERQYGAGA
jgi:hypothetical protein